MGHDSAHLSDTVSPSVSKHSFESLYDGSKVSLSASVQAKTRTSPKSKKTARRSGDVAPVPAFRSPLGKMQKYIVRDVMETAPTVQVLAGKVQEISKAVRVSFYICEHTCMYTYVHTDTCKGAGD